jgi:hypothetical protein
MAYTEQITFLLFLKMADELTRPPYNRKPIVPPEQGWPSLLERDGDELDVHYRHILEELAKKPGMLGAISKKARQEIQNPATLRRLIVDLIGVEDWTTTMSTATTPRTAAAAKPPGPRTTPRAAGGAMTTRSASGTRRTWTSSFPPIAGGLRE